MTLSVPEDYRLWIPEPLESPVHFGLSFTPWASFFGVRSRLFTTLDGELQPAIADSLAWEIPENGLSVLAGNKAIGDDDDPESDEDDDEDAEEGDDEEDDEDEDEDGDEDEEDEDGDEVAQDDGSTLTAAAPARTPTGPRAGHGRFARKPAVPAETVLKAVNPPEIQRLR